MKSILFLSALSCMLFVLACDESPVSDPVSASSLFKGEDDVAFPGSGSRAINEDVLIQSAANEAVLGHLSGSFRFRVSPSPILAEDFHQVELSFDANLVPMNGTEPVWRFTGHSINQVRLDAPTPSPSLPSSTTLRKMYRVGPGLTMALTVVYRVTATGVTIESMSCYIPEIPT